MTVVPMVFGSLFCVVIGSLVTKPPSPVTIEKYFSEPKMAAVPATVAA
jgi:hypothetical protein